MKHLTVTLALFASFLLSPALQAQQAKDQPQTATQSEQDSNSETKTSAPRLQAPQQRAPLSFGDPIPLSQRSVILPAMGFEFSFRYGLVGDGPTRFVNDLRFAPLSWLELRSSLNPYPDSLMLRMAFGALNGPGTFSFDGGLYKLDLGLRLNPDEAEAVKGVVVVNLGVGLGYDHSITQRGRLHSQLRFQQRHSNIDGWDQSALLAAAWGDLDLTKYLALSLGLSYARVLGGESKDFVINFSEAGRGSFSSLLDFENTEALSSSLSMTYARTERFDVDIFSTQRLWPEPGILFGAGLRVRL